MALPASRRAASRQAAARARPWSPAIAPHFRSKPVLGYLHSPRFGKISSLWSPPPPTDSGWRQESWFFWQQSRCCWARGWFSFAAG